MPGTSVSAWRRLLPGHNDDEAGVAARLLQGERAVVGFDESERDAEPQAGPLAHFLGRIKRLEHAGPDLTGNPRAAVGDADFDLFRALQKFDFHPFLRRAQGGVKRVVQKIQQRLRNLHRLAIDPCLGLQPADRELDRIDREALVAQAQRLLDDRADPLGPERIFRTVAREHPEPVDDLRDSAACVGDPARTLPQKVLIDGLPFVDQFLKLAREHENRRQWIVDLMSDPSGHFAQGRQLRRRLDFGLLECHLLL